MSKLTVVAKITAKKDSVENVKNELLKLIGPTRKEYGCIEYTLHRDNEDPAVFLFYETWENIICLENHMKTDHFKNYVNAVDSLIEEKIVHKMTRIA
jgi:quinol monooxygenase YgiN